MSLEAASWISQLTATNPTGTDTKNQGDDHLRLLKTVLQANFPNASKAFRFPDTVAKSANYTVLSTDDNKSIVCDTATAFTLTLPTLVAGDAGWSVRVVKTTTDANPVFIAPPSGTINGHTKIRRAIPYNETVVRWTGSVFVASRAIGTPVGSRIPYHGSTLPAGFLWPDGATFTAADFVELNTALGGNTKPDTRGRFGAGKDNMGGSPASRLTNAAGGVDGATLGASGGDQTRTIAQANLPAVTLPTTIASGQGSHQHEISVGSNLQGGGGGTSSISGTVPADPAGAVDLGDTDLATLPAMTGTTPLGGSGTALQTLPPTLVQNELLVCE